MDIADGKIEKQEKVSERLGVVKAESWEASRSSQPVSSDFDIEYPASDV